MGVSQSRQEVEEDNEQEDDDEEEDDNDASGIRELDNHSVKKVLEQEPEMLPCYASASPLSPQLSSFGTPRLGPSIKVWDPYNVLAPPPPPPPAAVFSRSFSSSGLEEDRMVIEGIRFNAVYSSPLDRGAATAASVCQELNFAEEQIQPSDALVEMSQGHWEGCPRSEIYTPEMLSLMERFQPDFSAPSGESLRQVEFRMVQFLNATVLDCLKNHDAEDEISPGEANQSSLHEINVRSSSSCISSSVGVFTHSGPIKCLLTGILGCSPEMSHKFCIEDSSVTVLQHSWKTGWQIKRLNDTAHLRLL
ncbi:hypothetical protein CK203_015045 [Vitis vinifera]|uniref:Uncharacterized protein n=1 Tax=Vitis vinifera TaxID=29760 RepID=A0A438JD92_VITVI|nr:hypothetical protein CK203_015045 [Vitis vinifera]